jgi:DNA-binding Lrp family transcriptional regulator
MDGKDRDILRILLVDGRATLKSIARRVELPITTVHNRMESMEGDGVFRPTVGLDRRKLGYSMDFYVLATVDTSAGEVDQEKLAKKIAAIPGVLDASVITGSRDLLVRATASDIDGLNEVVLKRIRGAGSVASTETLVVMKHFTGKRENLLRHLKSSR